MNVLKNEVYLQLGCLRATLIGLVLLLETRTITSLLIIQVLFAVMLRRTKQERAADVKLPPLQIKTLFLDLNEHEQDFYECIYKQTNSKFNTYVAKGTLMHNYAHIFELLSRLRQAVDHPYLVTCSDSHLQSLQTSAVAPQGR